MDSHFQVYSERFDWVQVRALAGPPKDIHRAIPKALLCCPGCLLRVIVLSEGGPWAQVLGSWALWSRFSLRISPHFAFFPTSNFEFWVPDKCKHSEHHQDSPSEFFFFHVFVCQHLYTAVCLFILTHCFCHCPMQLKVFCHSQTKWKFSAIMIKISN